MKSKHFQKGLEQLTDEGAIQVFYPANPGNPDAILGAVGELQFEVFQYRMEAEYGVKVELSRLPYELARWIEGDAYTPRRFAGTDNFAVTDKAGRNVLLFRNQWSMNYVVQQNESLTFKETAFSK
jgi:peptide chain release factor 3